MLRDYNFEQGHFPKRIKIDKKVVAKEYYKALIERVDKFLKDFYGETYDNLKFRSKFLSVLLYNSLRGFGPLLKHINDVIGPRVLPDKEKEIDEAVSAFIYFVINKYLKGEL